MSYCTRQDVVRQLSERGLAYLLDDDGDGETSSGELEPLDAAIESASAEIDLALRPHVHLPLVEPNVWLRDRGVDLAAERLAQRKGQDVPPSLAAAARRSRVWLEQVRTGQIRPPGLEYAADADPRARLAGLPRVLNVERNET
jgi:phage gp36-like protein